MNDYQLQNPAYRLSDFFTSDCILLIFFYKLRLTFRQNDTICHMSGDGLGKLSLTEKDGKAEGVSPSALFFSEF